MAVAHFSRNHYSNTMHARFLSTSATRLNRLGPRFVTTLKEASKPALERAQPITRPFGFDSKVTISGTDASVLNAFSTAAKEKRQKQLDHDIVHSPFYESKSFANTEGKIFSPPVSYFKRDKAKYFPNFTGYTLSNHKESLYDILKGKVTILRIFSTISGENCTNTYVEKHLSKDGYEEFLQKYPHAQIVDLNIPQSWIKGMFVKLAKSNLRNIVAPARHDKYFILPNSMFSVDVKKTLKCDNMCSGYLYVLDDEGRIRWATSGYADNEEEAVLWKTVKGIEKEITGASN